MLTVTQVCEGEVRADLTGIRTPKDLFHGMTTRTSVISRR